MMKISVILPVHSEKESLTQLTDTLVPLLHGTLHEIIIIVSPISPPDTIRIADDLAVRYDCLTVQTQRKYPGLGRAIRQGISAASGTHLLFMDTDGEMDPYTVPRMIEKMRDTGCDIVVASRWTKGGGARGYGPFKYILNRMFQRILKLFFGTGICDLTLGFKLMKKEKIDPITFDSIFHEIAMETTLRPIKKGLRVQEVPTVWVRRKSGASKNRFLSNFRYVKKAGEILLAR